MKKMFLTLLALGVAVAMTSPAGPTASAHVGSSPFRTWQTFARPTTMPSFLHPHGIAVDARGNLYVADSDHYQIQKISPSGARLAVVGSFGFGPGHFRALTSVAVDRWGNVYASDALNATIQKFSPTGRLLAVFRANNLDWLRSVAVDAEGHIYVSFSAGIEKLSAQGTVLATWRSFGGPMAIDPQGNVYVALCSHGICKLSPQGNVLASWPYPNGSGWPHSLALDAQGGVYIAESSRIIKFSSAGAVLARWGAPGVPGAPGLFQSPTAVAVGAGGRVYVADSGNQHLDTLSPTGRLLAVWGMHGRTPGRYRFPFGVAVDRQGNVYVADTRNSRVQKLSSKGVPLLQWGTQGKAPGQFNYPTSVAVSRQGNVVVADYGNYRLQTFSPSGKLLGVVRVPGPPAVRISDAGFQYGLPQQLPGVMSLALGAQGTMLVTDPGNHRLERLSPTGKLLAIYRGWPPAPYSTPVGVAVDRGNNIYVGDEANGRVVKLSPSGRLLAAWGSLGAVTGVAVEAHGNIYIADTYNDRIQELSPTGRPLAVWRGMGAAPGQFMSPMGVSIGSGGAVYVADTYNDRIQRLTP